MLRLTSLVQFVIQSVHVHKDNVLNVVRKGCISSSFYHLCNPKSDRVVFPTSY